MNKEVKVVEPMSTDLIESLEYLCDYFSKLTPDEQRSIIIGVVSSEDLISYYKGKSKVFDEYIVKLENAKNKIANCEKKTKDMLKNVFEENDLRKLDMDGYKANYIDATTRETFDTKKFREENLDLYDKYVKITPVAPQIKITLKKD